MPRSEKGRDQFIDRLRGLAIVLVVLGHAIQYGNGHSYLEKALFFDNLAFKLIYGFHMPLFMLLSGYLFSLTIDSRSSGTLLSARVRTLLLPIFAWGGVDFLIRVGNGQVAITPHYLHIFKAYLSACNEIWFLWAVFYNSLLAIVVYKYLNNNWVAYVLIGVCLFVTPDAYNAHLYKFMYPFFFLPLWYKTASIRQPRVLGTAWIAILAALVYFILIRSYWHYNEYIYTSGVTLLGKMHARQFYIDVARWGAGFVGAFAIISLTRRFQRVIGWSDRHDFLAILGRRSLGIYLISGLAFSYVVPQITHDESFSWTRVIFVSVAVTAACALLTEAIARVHLLNRVFLGGRGRPPGNSLPRKTADTGRAV